jgi:RNA polymerase sigma-70 factor (ECF subfamily)
VFAVCYRYLGNREDAADLTQEVFIRAYRSISRFRGDSAFSTWLHRIAVNACLSFKTSASQRRRPEELADDVVDTQTPSADERLDARMRGAALREALATLPEKQRMTVILKVIEDRTHAEVAEMLGITVGTVKANLFYAIQNLRRRIRGGNGAIQ